VSREFSDRDVVGRLLQFENLLIDELTLFMHHKERV
jgi:hypothetical protein